LRAFWFLGFGGAFFSARKDFASGEIFQDKVGKFLVTCLPDVNHGGVIAFRALLSIACDWQTTFRTTAHWLILLF